MVLSLNAVQREKLGCEENTNGSPCFILSEPPKPSFLQSLLQKEE